LIESHAPFCFSERRNHVANQRLKGQETSVLLVVNGAVQDTITDVRSFEIASKLELKEEGYLGEKTNRR
jgi:hypothetical protein